MVHCTLKLGGLIVLVAEGGVPEAEYTLFDPGEIQLHASGPATVHEAGYRTHVGEARARLEAHGVTLALAEEAADVVRPAIARAYARAPAVKLVADRLESAELFEGRDFDAASGRYAGAWLNLTELAADLALPGAPALMQAIHLAALLAERSDDDEIVLRTAEVTAQLKPGERTFKRVSLDLADDLLTALRALPPRTLRATTEPPESSGAAQALVDGLRARGEGSPAARERLATLEALLAERVPPSRGPLADPELWALEARLSRGEVAGVTDRLDDIERRAGRLPGTIYLRARLALMTRSEEPPDIAERMSALSTSMPEFHELELLAAQAWAAAGDARRAKAFARDLIDNAQASDALREKARDVLRGAATRPPTAGPTPASSSSLLPPIPRPPPTPSGVLDGLPGGERVGGPLSGRSGVPPKTDEARERPTWRAPGQEAVPSFRVEWADTPRDKRSFHPAAPDEAEPLETLSMPPGLQGAVAPPLDEPPHTPAAARMVFTHLTRELGRELRMRHSIEVLANLDGLEVAQRFLRERLADGRPRSRDEERELLRHGAFVSELLARRLGARWIDLESDESSRWALAIPTARGSETIRVWPFARVLRFITMGHRERDLVSYSLELEARAR